MLVAPVIPWIVAVSHQPFDWMIGAWLGPATVLQLLTIT
jgi:hypothetical protein